MGKYRYAVARPTSARSATAATVGTWPSANSSSAAAIRARRVRSVWRGRVFFSLAGIES